MVRKSPGDFEGDEKKVGCRLDGLGTCRGVSLLTVCVKVFGEFR